MFCRICTKTSLFLQELPDLQSAGEARSAETFPQTDRRSLRGREEESPDEAGVRRLSLERGRQVQDVQVLRRSHGLRPRPIRVLRLLEVQTCLLRWRGQLRSGRVTRFSRILLTDSLQILVTNSLNLVTLPDQAMGRNADDYDPSELVCGGCSDVSRAQMCPKHGTDYLEYKCRYCCSVAVFFCFGTTHFCNACHDDFSRVANVPKNELPQCPVGPRATALATGPGGGEAECPLHVKHPPTGEEFALGCGICRNAHTF